jgi:hypothetical protein
MTYRDLSIHQRITAKGNSVKFYWSYMIIAARFHESKPLNLISRMVRRDPALACPAMPFYNMQVKTNHYDPTPWETRY